MTEQQGTFVTDDGQEVPVVKKVRKQRSDKGQKRTKPYNLKKNKETT